MLKVGLTGSIAVGKSFVCSMFRELGCDVLDADQTARDVVLPGTVGLKKITDHFGNDILKENGELDRAKLGAIVFADRDSREMRNSIVHPLVFEAQDCWFTDREAKNPDGIAIVDAALMIESGGYKRFTKLIVVWCEPAIQLKRLMARDAISEAEARRRIDAQMPQDEKKKYADFLIDTSNGYEDTRRQAAEIFERLNVLTKETSGA